MRNDWIGNWLFVFGSVIFTFDASIDLLEVCTVRASLRLLACLLFTVGCFLLMPREQEGDRSANL